MLRNVDPPRRSYFGTVTVPGTPAGAIVSLGLVIICWFAIAIARPFILGTGLLGILFALVLRSKHR